MTTALTLINETREMLLAGTREAMNVLATALTDTTGVTVVFTYELEGIQVGAVIEIESELMRVVAVTPATKTATVTRGYGNSTAATHLVSTPVFVNPKFSKQAIFSAMNDQIDELSGEGLFQIVVKELTYSSAVDGYDLTSLTVAEEVFEVTYQDTGSQKRWPRMPRTQWELRRNAETDDFASGFALFLTGEGQQGRELRVLVKAPFTRLTTIVDDVNSVAGLASTANGLLKYGAAMKLVYWRETMRSVFESQGDSRRAEEVPMGAQISAARAWGLVYQRVLNNEKARIARQYPPKRY